MSTKFKQKKTRTDHPLESALTIKGVSSKKFRVYSTNLYDRNPDNLSKEKSVVVWARIPKWLYDEYKVYCDYIARDNISSATRDLIKYHMKLLKEAQRKSEELNSKKRAARDSAKSSSGEL